MSDIDPSMGSGADPSGPVRDDDLDGMSASCQGPAVRQWVSESDGVNASLNVFVALAHVYALGFVAHLAFIRQAFIIDRVLKINCRALLFDMDGVLIDSTPAVARVWKRWAFERGFDPDIVAAMAQGRPSITTIRELLPNADHLAENREVERREMEDLDGVTACPGALDMLTQLPSSLWALVTSSTKPLAEVRLRAAGLPLPKLLVTGSDVARGKPHPEPFLKGASLVGFPPEQCVVVEDTPAGIRAGKTAGARVLAFRTTMPEPELRAAAPDWVVDSCASLQVAGASGENGIELLLQT